VPALAPLIVRDLLHGGAQTFGVMFGAIGIGAVTAAVNIPYVRNNFDHEKAARFCVVGLAVAATTAALSHTLILTVIALALNGACWMLSSSLFGITVQLTSPRWVTARLVATFQALTAGS